MKRPLFSLIAFMLVSVLSRMALAETPPVITDISVWNDGVDLSWKGGMAPFQIESSQNMTFWEVVAQTSETTVKVPKAGDAAAYLRVVSSPSAPELGEYVGQLRVDEGEFGGRLARHRLKSLWDFYLPKDGEPSRVPETYFRELVLRLVYRDGNELETFVGKLEDLPDATITSQAQTMTVRWCLGQEEAKRDYVLEMAFPYSIEKVQETIHLSDPRYTLHCTYVSPQLELGYQAGASVIEETLEDEVSLYQMSEGTAPEWWKRAWTAKVGKVSVETEFVIGVPLLEGSEAFIWKTPLLHTWGRTVISGLTSQPIQIEDRFTQTYDPFHHNFVETLWIEPELHPSLPAETLAELRAANIRFLVVTNPTAFPGEKPSLQAVGFDSKLRDL